MKFEKKFYKQNDQNTLIDPFCVLAITTPIIKIFYQHAWFKILSCNYME